MKELQTSLRDRHIDELKTVTRLICEIANPNAIILFGHYAGSKQKSAIGGYELLIVMPEAVKISVSQIRKHIDNGLSGKRTEVPIHLLLLSSGFIHKFYHTSYLLYKISQDGIVLYRCPSGTKSVFPKKNALRIGMVYNTAKKNFSRHFASGKAFLENAREHIHRGTHEAAGFALYMALYQYFIALEYIYYGFHLDSRDLITFFRRLRHASGELNEQLDLSKPANRCFLSHINRYFKVICRQPEQPPAISYGLMVEYIKRVEEVELIVLEEWQGREQLYLSFYPQNAKPRNYTPVELHSNEEEPITL